MVRLHRGWGGGHINQTSLESSHLTEEAEEQETPTPEPIDTTTPEPIIHEMIPDEPLDTINTHLTDFNSIGYAHEGFTYADQFLINRFERPFTV